MDKKLEIKTEVIQKEIVVDAVVFQTEMNKAEAFEFVAALEEMCNGAMGYFLNCGQQAKAENNTFGKKMWDEKWNAAFDLSKVFEEWLEEHKEWGEDEDD